MSFARTKKNKQREEEKIQRSKNELLLHRLFVKEKRFHDSGVRIDKKSRPGTKNLIPHHAFITVIKILTTYTMNAMLTSSSTSSSSTMNAVAAARRPSSSSSSSSPSSSTRTRGYQKFTITNRYGRREKEHHPASSKEVAKNTKNSSITNNTNTNSNKVLFASGLGASLVGLLTPSAAMAISITDPVFGDIEVWQFLILTAGYWIAIEAYLDNKYDDDKKTVMPTLKKKDEDDDE